MAAVSSNSGPTAAQYGLAQLRLQQLKRSAERAEQTAEALQAQASAARQDANQADERARSVEVDASNARSSALAARQGLALIQSTRQNEARLARVSENMVVQQSGQKPTTPAAPVVNVQGQVTGRVVNTTA